MLTGAGKRGLSTLPSRAVMVKARSNPCSTIDVRDRSARSGNRRRPPAPAAGGYWPGPLVWSAEPEKSKCDAVAASSRRRRGCAPAFPDRCRRRRRSARPRSARPSIRRSLLAQLALPTISNRRSKQARILSLPNFADQLDQPPLAQPVGAELAADVAEHQFRRAAVGGDDALDVAVGACRALIAHRRKMQAFVEGLARLARSSFPAPARRCRSCARSSRRSRTARRRRTPA